LLSSAGKTVFSPASPVSPPLLSRVAYELLSGGGLNREVSAMRVGGGAGGITVSQADVSAMQRRIGTLEKDIAELKALVAHKK
jgi:hypothetical protein